MTIQAARTRLSESLNLVIGRWAIWLAAGVIGGAFTAAGYGAFRFTPATYPEFVVGYETLAGFGKAGEFAMLLGFILGASAFFVLIAGIFQKLFTLGGALAVDEAYRHLMIAVFPALAWAASSIFPGSESLKLFFVGVAFICATTIGIALLNARPALWFTHGQRVAPVLDAVLLIPIAAILAVFAIAMIGNRIGLVFGPMWFTSLDALHLAASIAGLAAIAVVATVALRSGNHVRVVRLYRNLLLAIQVLFPALFLALLPSPIGTVNPAVYDRPVSGATWALVSVLTCVLWIDLYRLWRRGNRDNDDPASTISIFSLIAVLVYCRIPYPELVPAPMDDYHAGEDFIPWWSWIKHGMIPLWDFTPPRGLINYAMGFLSSIFTEQTAGGLLATRPYIFVATVLLVFPAITLAIGKWRAFLVLFFAALDDRIGDIDALVTAAFCILIFAWDRFSHVAWLVIWIVVGTGAVLIAPGQGGLLVIATLPGGLWQFYQAYQTQRARLLPVAGLGVVAFALLALTTPLGLMILGAVRYGAGQSAVNAIANGLPWREAFGRMPGAAPWLVEILQFSWIGAGVAAIVLTIWVWASPARDNRNKTIFIGVTIAILCAVYIVRASVRLDPGVIGRPGWASLWALGLLLPILLTAALRGTQRLSALVLVLVIAATLTARYSVAGIDLAILRPILLQPAPASVPNFVDGAAIGMPNMGRISMPKGQVNSLVAIKHQIDEWLLPNETYLDMTNGGARYYYFDRRPPSDLSAFYNMITADQQKRTVAEIVKQRVPMAVIGPFLNLDGLKASLRAHLVYRHLALNFVPVSVDGYDYMMNQELLMRSGISSMMANGPTASGLDTLDHAFLTTNLGRLPLAMGQSAFTLDNLMRNVATLEPLSVTDARKSDDGSYTVTGDHPAVTFDISVKNPAGRDAGILRFDFACGKAKPTLAVGWTSGIRETSSSAPMTFEARNGPLIVPLDSAPRWLLSSSLSRLKLEITNLAGCTAFTLSNVTLAQRTDVDDLETELLAAGSK